MSGAEPAYDPEPWNAQPDILTHNCYAYFLDDLSPNARAAKPQPGVFSLGASTIDRRDTMFGGKYTSCAEMEFRVLSDNPDIYVSSPSEPCRPGYYKGMLALAPGSDYHFYRQDAAGTFSHKRGAYPVENTDSRGDVIFDPRTAEKKYPQREYTENCAFFCIPQNGKIKTNAKS